MTTDNLMADSLDLDGLEKMEAEMRRQWQVDRPKATRAWARKRSAAVAVPHSPVMSRTAGHRPILSANR
jgi:hypothetical protein